jgi:hypothetical protein
MKGRQKRSYPEPPEIFSEAQNQADIYNRILGAIEPKEAERDVATINKRSWKSKDLDPGGDTFILSVPFTLQLLLCLCLCIIM